MVAYLDGIKKNKLFLILGGKSMGKMKIVQSYNAISWANCLNEGVGKK